MTPALAARPIPLPDQARGHVNRALAYTHRARRDLDEGEYDSAAAFFRIAGEELNRAAEKAKLHWERNNA